MSVHDRQQFEIAWHYSYGGRAHTRYRVDVYFFLPTSIGITPETYNPAAFFGDAQAYIRLATPKLGPKQLIESGPSSPFPKLHAALEAQSGGDEGRIILHAKLAGCVVRAAIRRQFRKLMQACSGPGAGKAARKADDFCRNVRGMLERMGELARCARSDKLASSFSHIEDYLSMVGLEAANEALYALQQKPCGEAADGEADHRAAIDTLAGFVLDQSAARERRHWPTLRPGLPADQLETLMYRRSLLKKYIFGALFLKVRPVRSRNLVQHFVGAIGAFLAAVWAFFSNPALFGTVTINSLTFAVLFVAVFGYILKDRIKELTRQYLAGRFRKWLPDRDRRVLPSELVSGVRKPMGRVREYIEFVPAEKVGRDVHALRNAVHTIDTGEEAAESILHYAKVIELWRQPDLAGTTNGIKDMLRFNVQHLLTRLDESIGDLYAYDPESGTTARVEGGHVYHVNMVMRCSRDGESAEDSSPLLERLRLVLNKAGIVRVEPVVLDREQEQADEEHVADDSD